MKDIYINARLHALLLRCGVVWPRRTWIFSQGEPWLYLSPKRLRKLVTRLGVGDHRIGRILRLVRRHVLEADDYLRQLGLPRVYDEEASCPECGELLADDAESLCPACRQIRDARAGKPTPLQLRDMEADRRKRAWMQEHDPEALDDRHMYPFTTRIRLRKVKRDWPGAMRMLYHGLTYREVSEHMGCSVGLLHRRVKERYWEDN